MGFYWVYYLVEVQFGSDTMTPSITAPSFDQFTVENERQSVQTVGEGKDQHQVLKKIWRLTPNQAGHLSIAAAIITYQDPTTLLLKNGKTRVQFVEVLPSEPAAAPVAAPAARIPTWWVWPGAGLILIAGAWLFFRRRRPAAAPSLPARPAEDTALQALEALRRQVLTAAGAP